MKDFLLDEDGDLLIVNGDLVIGDSDATIVEHLMHSFKGEWKESPLTGVEAPLLIKKRGGITRLKKIAKQQLQENRFKNISITQNGKTIDIDADSVI